MRLRELIAGLLPHWHHEAQPRMRPTPEIEQIVRENHRVRAEGLKSRDELLRAEDEVIRRRGVPQ